MRLKIQELGGVTIVDTKKAQRVWRQRRDSSKYAFERETLYLSANGRYYVVTESLLLGIPQARFVTPEHAAAWLRLNGYDLPEDLIPFDRME